MVKHWINSTDKDSQNMFRKENKDGYSYYSKGFRAAANGDLLRQKTLGDGVVKERIVVPNSRSLMQSKKLTCAWLIRGCSHEESFEGKVCQCDGETVRRIYNHLPSCGRTGATVEEAQRS